MDMDVERTMQFILEMQARHEAAIQKHDEQIAQNASQIAQNSAQIAGVTDLIGRLAAAEIRLVERIDRLAVKINEMRDAQRDAQAATDYKLNALIETVDKLVHRNGGKAS